MVKLYHYTDEKGIIGILTAGKIEAKYPHGGAVDMPFGVYLTELKPTTTTKQLIINNYDDRQKILKSKEFRSKVKYYIEIESKEFPKAYQNKNTQRNEWIIPHDIDLYEVEDFGERAHIYISLETSGSSDTPLDPNDAPIGKHIVLLF